MKTGRNLASSIGGLNLPTEPIAHRASRAFIWKRNSGQVSENKTVGEDAPFQVTVHAPSDSEASLA